MWRFFFGAYTMHHIKLKAAIQEAERFLFKANQLDLLMTKYEQGGKLYYFNEPKDQGAVKRASMDLTSALADLRRPG